MNRYLAHSRLFSFDSFSVLFGIARNRMAVDHKRPASSVGKPRSFEREWVFWTLVHSHASGTADLALLHRAALFSGRNRGSAGRKCCVAPVLIVLPVGKRFAMCTRLLNQLTRSLLPDKAGWDGTKPKVLPNALPKPFKPEVKMMDAEPVIDTLTDYDPESAQWGQERREGRPRVGRVVQIASLQVSLRRHGPLSLRAPAGSTRARTAS